MTQSCITVSYLQPTLLHWYFYLTNHCNTSDTMLDEYLKITAKKTGRPRTYKTLVRRKVVGKITSVQALY